MPRNRKLFAATVSRTPDSDKPYQARINLTLGAITAEDAQNVAARVAVGLNDQLDYAQSDYRVGFFDAKTGKRVAVSFKHEGT